MNARGVAAASGIGLTLALGIYSLMGSFGGPFETSHSPVPDPLTLNTLKVGVLDAGTVYTHYLANVDGGAVYAPGGLTVGSMSYVRFDGPGSSARIHYTGGNLSLEAGGGLKVGIVGGGFSQDEFKAGELSANALQINGGASMASISVVNGTGGPAGDAGIDMVPVGEGFVAVWGSGLRTHTINNADGGGVLDLRGDVQIDDRRPLVALDAGTPSQRFAVGVFEVPGGGSGSENFTEAFPVAPVCACSPVDDLVAVQCGSTAAAVLITAAAGTTINYICIERR